MACTWAAFGKPWPAFLLCIKAPSTETSNSPVTVLDRLPSTDNSIFDARWLFALSIAVCSSRASSRYLLA